MREAQTMISVRMRPWLFLPFRFVKYDSDAPVIALEPWFAFAGLHKIAIIMTKHSMAIVTTITFLIVGKEFDIHGATFNSVVRSNMIFSL